MKPKTAFQEIGGEPGVRRLVKTFYDIVEADPRGEPVHRLHLGRMGMEHVREAQFAFLCGFLGGPRYYVERTGRSDLRQIHAHLDFGREEADAWLACMRTAIARINVPPSLEETLMRGFSRAADVLVDDARSRSHPAPGDDDRKAASR